MIVTMGIGYRLFVQCQGCGDGDRVLHGPQAGQYILHVLTTRPPGFEGQFHGYQHGIQPMHRNGCQHIGHDPVAAGMLQEVLLQVQQRFRHLGKRRAVAQGPGFALDQVDVMAEIVEGLIALEAAGVPGNLLPIGYELQGIRVDAQADDAVGVVSGHAVAVALEMDERGAGNPDRFFDITIEGPWIGHHLELFIFEQLANGEGRPFGVRGMGPGFPALHGQPIVEAVEVGPALLSRSLPDLPASVLDVLFNNAFLPASGPVAELGIEQVVAAHGVEAGVDGALLAMADLVDGGLHVVVDAAPGDAAKGGKGPAMGVEEHFMALAGIGDHPEGATGAEFDVGDFEAAAQAANEGVFAAPVELEGFAQGEGERDVGAALGALVGFGFPAPDEGGDSGIAAGVTVLAQGFIEHPAGAAFALGTMAVGVEPLPQLVRPRIKVALVAALGVFGLNHLRLAQPATKGVAG